MKRRYTKITKREEPTVSVDPMRIMKRAEVAALFQVSKIRIDQLATAGILRKVMLPGLSRSLGFVAEEVYALLEKRQNGGAA